MDPEAFIKGRTGSQVLVARHHKENVQQEKTSDNLLEEDMNHLT
jgi:hypothetical protein